MELIIDIPKEVYTDIMIHNREFRRESGKSAYYFEGLIQHGIPIPDNGIINVVLDKIRDEIELQRKEVSKKHSKDGGLSNYYFGLNDGLKDARDILDKYKAERR